MKDVKKDIAYALFSGLLSLILANLGAIIIKEFPDQPYLGIMTIVLAFLILYFSSYVLQIRNNKNKIVEIEERLEKFQSEKEIRDKLLNTMKDIILVNSTKKKK